MKFCADCGTSHECTVETGDRASDAVRIAELETRRDIEVARITARADRAALEADVEIAETEADASVEVAAAEAEVIGTILAEADPPESDPGPVITVAPDISQEADPEELPPVEGSPAPEASTTRGLGMWG
jgi:hypothetical protein